jgi:hypothetical protein
MVNAELPVMDKALEIETAFAYKVLAIAAPPATVSDPPFVVLAALVVLLLEIPPGVVIVPVVLDVESVVPDAVTVLDDKLEAVSPTTGEENVILEPVKALTVSTLSRLVLVSSIPFCKLSFRLDMFLSS